jgi:3-oxoacyl-[acyl-carrier protein] reductase
MLLENKNAVVYGGGGAIGGAVARAFAREGATVHLAGRTISTLQQVADDIRVAGGAAEAAQVDAFDADEVDEHAGSIVAAGGSLDVSFNVISHPDHMGTPVLDMRYEDFEEPVTRRLRTMWITSRAAARHMVQQGAGVILTYGGYGDPVANYGGFQVSFGAIEALRRTWPASSARAACASSPSRPAASPTASPTRRPATPSGRASPAGPCSDGPRRWPTSATPPSSPRPT